MATRKASDSNLSGKKYNDASAGGTKIADLPDAPTIGAVADTQAGGQITVAFTAAATGGTATSFTATSTPNSITGSNSASPITVSGLTNGTSYSFTVYASNSSGNSSSSQPSTTATPTAPLTRGLLAGGQFSNRIGYVNLATTGDEVFFGNISSSAKLGPSGFASSTRGVIGNGVSG